jgi:putative peptidoglycan lipid II flippase
VLQLSVAIDRGISYLLAQSLDQHDQLITHFSFFGHWVRYPMELGAAPRLYWAQLLYQFPLGVFAIAVATAIFPTLSADALDNNRERFRGSLRRGIKLTFWEGLPASVGLIMVAQPAVQLLFEYGRFKGSDTTWVASSVRLYSIAIWALRWFNSLQYNFWIEPSGPGTPVLFKLLSERVVFSRNTSRST